MHEINWGIIGCGDVTEVKSGPAFNKVPYSRLVAVMRRNAAKAEDYARRHLVPNWYADAQQLIDDPKVNAIYIATPPLQHEEYTLAALQAGKPVYVEKPMAVSYAAALNMANAVKDSGIKLTVAHYRRQWPMVKKIKSLLEEKAIGDVRLVRLIFDKPAQTDVELKEDKAAWRVDAAISGGGLFYDLAPHQLDILYLLFGVARQITGVATSQDTQYSANDLVIGNILFRNNIAFSGTWCFTAPVARDTCEIMGSHGNITFSFFSRQRVTLTVNDQATHFDFEPLQHVQQPMIEASVNYFLGQGPNPCTAEEGAEIMRWIEIMDKG